MNLFTYKLHSMRTALRTELNRQPFPGFLLFLRTEDLEAELRTDSTRKRLLRSTCNKVCGVDSEPLISGGDTEARSRGMAVNTLEILFMMPG